MTQRQAENIVISRCKSVENSLFVMFDELSGTINLCGDNVWMGALQQNLNLKKQLEDTLLKAKKSMTRDQKLTLTTEVPRLFAIPNTKESKPIEKIRKTLTRLLLFLEVGHNKNIARIAKRCPSNTASVVNFVFT